MSQNPPGAATKPRAPTASTTALKDASAQLQLAMSIHYSGEADKDFAALLAAYQKGATAIANIELQHGTDPDIRQLAEQIKAANEKDAALIQGWQAKHR